MKVSGLNFDTTYTDLPKQFFTELSPVPVESPSVVIVNTELAESMGIDLSHLNEEEQAALFSGNTLPEGATPFSQAYSGHQFGHFTNLGDGRAHVLGEHLSPRNERFDIQFKGSGQTPYSRRGDGRAVLGPMLREYIISEAMHALGIPTTRSLAVATTGEPVMRDTALPGAILTRVASSHIRVGTFEFATLHEDKESLSTLLNYTIKRHFPDLIENENKALALLEGVMIKQVALVVDWMRVGFIHGVMNTDNMALSGETIDYGPCAFMDTYNLNTVFSSIDRGGRYAYGNQPKIAQWNLARLAEALLSLIDENEEKAIELAKEYIDSFADIFQERWISMMGAKLGLSEVQSDDVRLISDLLQWMQNNHVDYTNTFCALTKNEKPTGEQFQEKGFDDWYTRWQERLSENNNSLESSINLMKANNPVIIPRNHKVEEALEASHEGNFEIFNDLISVLKEPYSDRESLEPYKLPPEPSESVYQTFCGT